MAEEVKSELSYAVALSKLQDLVARLEGGDVPLEQLEESVREADTLLRFCYEKLYGTRERVEEITSSWDKLIKKDEQ